MKWGQLLCAHVCKSVYTCAPLCTTLHNCTTHKHSIVHYSAEVCTIVRTPSHTRALFCRSVHDCAPATAPSCTILQNCARLRAQHMSDKCVVLDRFQNQCFPYIQPFSDWKELQFIKSVFIFLSVFFLTQRGRNRAVFCRSVHDCARTFTQSCTILQKCA